VTDEPFGVSESFQGNCVGIVAGPFPASLATNDIAGNRKPKRSLRFNNLVAYRVKH
jgi:hypothetical protein